MYLSAKKLFLISTLLLICSVVYSQNIITLNLGDQYRITERQNLRVRINGSYKGYLSYAKKWNWLHKDYIFSMITPKKQGRLKPFTKFMKKDDSEEVTRLFSLKKLPSFFGPESFITDIKEKYY